MKTMPGSTTPELRGSNGSVTFSFVIGSVSFCNAVMAIPLTGQPYGWRGHSRALPGERPRRSRSWSRSWSTEPGGRARRDRDRAPGTGPGGTGWATPPGGWRWRNGQAPKEPHEGLGGTARPGHDAGAGPARTGHRRRRPRPLRPHRARGLHAQGRGRVRVTGPSVVEGMVNRTAVRALCGKEWVPGRDPSRYGLCPTCKEIAESMGWKIPAS